MAAVTLLVAAPTAATTTAVFEARLTATDREHLAPDFEAVVTLEVDLETGRLTYTPKIRGVLVYINSLQLLRGQNGPALISLTPTGDSYAFLDQEKIALLRDGGVWMSLNVTKETEKIAIGRVMPVRSEAEPPAEAVAAASITVETVETTRPVIRAPNTGGAGLR
jgi:hypothetical protein